MQSLAVALEKVFLLQLKVFDPFLHLKSDQSWLAQLLAQLCRREMNIEPGKVNLQHLKIPQAK